MVRVLFVSLLLGAALFGVVAWSLELDPMAGFTGLAQPTVTDSDDPAATSDGKPSLGDDLYQPAAFPPIQSDPKAQRRADPVVLRGHMTFKDKQEVPSQVPGQVLFIGEAVPDGAVATAGVAAFLAEPFSYSTLSNGDGKTYKFYRRLIESQVVSNDQVVGMIDPSKALLMLEERAKKIDHAINKVKSAKAASDEADNRFIREKEIYARGGGAAADYGAAKAAKEKFHYDYLGEQDAVGLAREEYRQALLNYEQHLIRNKIPYKRSVIKQIHKSLGDAVKEQETVMSVYSLDRLLAEALVEDQYLGRLKDEMTVAIEPTVEAGPALTLRGAHRGEVTSVAVTNDKDRPRVLTGSVDRTVNVWDPHSYALPIRLWHNDVVRVVAASPVGAEHNLALVGTSDGTLYQWDVSDSGLKSDKREPLKAADAHPDAVTALAFSPDGKYLASGGADGGIALWRVEPGQAPKLVYRFDHEHGVDQPHQGTVTALHFTPQARLVSAARDNTVRVWKLKEKGAVLDGQPIANRGGNVSQLGVSRDGKWLLFDQGRTLQLVSLEHGGTVTTLQSPGASTPFETLALFAPNGELLLTAGGTEGRLQLWRAPTETQRGYEVRQLVTEGKLPPTAAAFAPRLGQGPAHAFAVSAAANGNVYFWSLPTKEDVENHRIENVPIKVVGRSLDPSRQVRIAVDVANPTSPQHPNGRLIPGRPVTIVIDGNE